MSKKNGYLLASLANKSVADRVVDQITGAIINGELKPGDKIPTEIELCESFQVGRNSVREAIKVLESFGVVYIKRSEGTFVSSEYNHRMLDPMLYGLILKKDSGDLIELRKVFDTGILYVVAGKAKATDLDRIKSTFKQLEEEVMGDDASAADVLELDLAFHRSINLSAHNELIENIANYIDRITIPSRVKTMEKILASGEKRQYVDLHMEVLSMIENRDFSLIQQTVDDHYMYWKDS